MKMGRMRLMGIMVFHDLPDVAEEFAADIFLAGLETAHDAFGGGDDGDAEAAADARDVRRADVTAQAGRADAFHAFDDALLALIFELELERFGQLAFDGKFSDVAFLFKNAGDALLHFGMRHGDVWQEGAVRIANAR